MKKVLSWIIAIGFSGILVQPVQWLLGLIPWEKFILKEHFHAWCRISECYRQMDYCYIESQYQHPM